MLLWGQQIGLNFFYFVLIIKEIYNCMTSSIYPFTDSLLILVAELTDSKSIQLLFFLEVQKPQ